MSLFFHDRRLFLLKWMVSNHKHHQGSKTRKALHIRTRPRANPLKIGNLSTIQHLQYSPGDFVNLPHLQGSQQPIV
jgi:hypothetical protein